MLRWRRVVVAGRPRAFYLKEGGARFGTVAFSSSHGAWYFFAAVGLASRNSLLHGETWPTADEAKAACKTWVQEQRATEQRVGVVARGGCVVDPERMEALRKSLGERKP